MVAVLQLLEVVAVERREVETVRLPRATCEAVVVIDGLWLVLAAVMGLVVVVVVVVVAAVVQVELGRRSAGQEQRDSKEEVRPLPTV